MSLPPQKWHAGTFPSVWKRKPNVLSHQSRSLAYSFTHTLILCETLGGAGGAFSTGLPQEDFRQYFCSLRGPLKTSQTHACTKSADFNVRRKKKQVHNSSRALKRLEQRTPQNSTQPPVSGRQWTVELCHKGRRKLLSSHWATGAADGHLPFY